MTASGQQFGDIRTRSMNTAADLTNKTYYLVNLDTVNDERVALAADATKFPFVLTEEANGSSTVATVTIAIGGRVKVKLGGTVSAGDKLTSNGSGLAITTVTNKDHYGLMALHNGVSGDIIEALVCLGTVSS